MPEGKVIESLHVGIEILQRRGCIQTANVTFARKVTLHFYVINNFAIVLIEF